MYGLNSRPGYFGGSGVTARDPLNLFLKFQALEDGFSKHLQQRGAVSHLHEFESRDIYYAAGKLAGGYK